VSGPRVLAIMGSGETAPTMAKVHRELFDRFAEAVVPAAVIDTPYGFQENADALSARMVEFFATSVGRSVAVATYRRQDVDAVTLATALARIREARYVMAGPGSPTYALRQWAGGPIPDALAAKLSDGGVVTMASAAALTLGVVTVPVYEVYKVGDDPHWVEGLDLLGPATGLRAAVVPHYDNAEGGNHDTRFCYMGERRLRMLERALPEGTFVLGVDGHTALVLDLEAGMAAVAGLGGVTVRVDGQSVELPAGSAVPIARLGEVASRMASGEAADVMRGAGDLAREPAPASRSASPLRDEMTNMEGSFVDALGRDDMHDAVQALLELDEAISGRIRAGEDSPDLDNASATFRSLIARLGEQAEAPGQSPRQVLEPLVTLLLQLRAAARAESDWSTADRIRDQLTAAGVEVRDDETGNSTWVMSETASR